MSLYVGIDIGIGVSSGASWTAVVVLSDEKSAGDRPVYAERFKPEINNLEKRLLAIASFCSSAIHTAASERLEPVKGALISEPKMRGIQKSRQNKRTLQIEKVTLNLRSMFDLTQARGAIVGRLESDGISVYSLVESTMKKAFTGDGRADKERIHRAASIQWPNIQPGLWDFSDALMVAEILKRRYTQLRRDRESQH